MGGLPHSHMNVLSLSNVLSFLNVLSFPRKRESRFGFWIPACAGMALLTLSVLAFAAGPDGIIAGSNYKDIEPPVPVEAAPGTVEVIEFLWYDCETCFVVEPTLARWLKEHAGQVTFKRVPAVVGSHMLYYARVFYAAEDLGILDQIHMPLYEAIHREGRQLGSDEEMAAFFAEHGVERGRFLSTFRNSVTASKVRNAQILTRRYDVAGAPTFVINGKYRVDPTMVPNAETLMQVVGYLVDRERGGK